MCSQGEPGIQPDHTLINRLFGYGVCMDYLHDYIPGVTMPWKWSVRNVKVRIYYFTIEKPAWWQSMMRRFVCSRKGHNWTDAGSYATPESGADILECTRCGEDFKHIYY